MFCPECGKELTEAEVTCPACGASSLPEMEAEPVQETLEDLQISIDDLQSQAASEVTEEEITEETEEETEEEEEEEEEEDEIVTDMDADAIVAEFLSESAAAEEASKQQQEEAAVLEPAPKKKQKKSHKKLWAILIPVIILALLAAAAGAVYFLATRNYEEAAACVEAKEYDKALALFEKFSFYSDSQERIDELNRLQKAYDDAASLAAANDYVSAIGVLSQLGDYRDSVDLAQLSLPYARAGYLMASAETGDVVALSQHPDYANAISTPDDPTVTLYEGAAAVYLSLGDHADSAMQASLCYRKIAFLCMEQELFAEALTYIDQMNEADREAAMAQYMTYCADEDALASLAEAVRIRASLEETLAQQLKEAEEAAQETTEETTEQTEETEETPVEEDKLTYLDLVEAEQKLLESFTSDLLYYDTQLKDAMAMYRKGLETEASALDAEGNCTDLAVWYSGSSMRALAVETLVELYNFLGDNPQLQASYAGKTYLYNAYSVLENVLPLYLTEEKQESSEEEGQFYTFENTTGITFTLTVTHEFLDEAGNTVLFHESDPVQIGADTTVKLPFMVPTEEETWSVHNITWTYEVTQNA